MIPIEILREYAEYNPKTGHFTRIKASTNACPVGSRMDTLTGHGYRAIHVSGKKLAAHRAAWLYMTGEWPTQEIDHVDGDRSNNKWENLRIAGRCNNVFNKPSTNPLGKGIEYNPKCVNTPWWACVQARGRRVRKGFATQAEAVAWATATRNAMHGEFARHS